MGGFRIKTLIISALFLILLFANTNASESDILIVSEDGSSAADSFAAIFNQFDIQATVIEELSLHIAEIDTVKTIFYIRNDREIPADDFQILSNFLDNGGNLYLEKSEIFFEFMHNQWFFDRYMRIDWTTCESYPFTSFHGVSGTFFTGLDFGFAATHYSSNMTPSPYDANMITVLEDNSAMCGCVAAASDVPDYRIILTGFDLENTDNYEYPNNRLDLFRKIFSYFGIGLSSVDETDGNTLPNDSALLSNYPNPFNSSTIIRLQSKSPNGDDLIDIYNLRGELVRRLKLDKTNETVWDSKDSRGDRLPSGIYFARLLMDNSNLTLKLSLIK